MYLAAHLKNMAPYIGHYPAQYVSADMGLADIAYFCRRAEFPASNSDFPARTIFRYRQRTTPPVRIELELSIILRQFDSAFDNCNIHKCPQLIAARPRVPTCRLRLTEGHEVTGKPLKQLFR